MKQLVRIFYESDFTITNSLPNGYDNEDFIIRLYTTDESSYYEAKFVEGTAYNCTLDGDKVTIYVNNHGLNAGCLHIVQAYDYDNNHFADGIENIKTSEESNIYLVKSNPNSTSAMFTGSALPDLTGSSDYITWSDLEVELADYPTDYELEATLESYATKEYVAEYVGCYGGNVDLSSYVTYSYLESKNYATSSEVDDKQDVLVSGTNIKTINGYSLLGNGNIEITGSGTVDLSSYITKIELSQAGYITMSDVSACGYITSIPAEYITEQELSLMAYATQTYVETYYVAKTAFIYDSTNHTLTINI